MARNHAAWCLFAAFSLVVPPPVATGGDLDWTFEDLLPGYSIARCLFAEGRLVLERGGEFLVLREGDKLPDRPRVRVLEIRDTYAVLAEGLAADVAAVPERMVKITRDPDGAVGVTLMSAEIPQADPAATLEPNAIFVPGDGSDPIRGSGTAGNPDEG